LNLAARGRLELGPSTAAGSLAEGAYGPLNRYSHVVDSFETQEKKARRLGGASIGPFWPERQCTLVPEPDGRCAAPVRAK